jgi:hypothetical protein
MQVRNYYHCAECSREWTDVWSCMLTLMLAEEY